MNLIQELRDGNAGLTGALFSTYTFTSEYFERMILKNVVERGVGSTVVVFTDEETYRNTLGTDSANIGNSYQLAPVSVPNRTYHAKICYLTGTEHAIGYVGSSNLTQRGLNSNREMLTRIRCDKDEVDALRDTSFDSVDDLNESQQETVRSIALLRGIHQYYQRLLEVPNSKNIGRIAQSHTETALDDADWIADTDDLMIDPTQQESFNRVVHNIDTPLWEQLQAQITQRNESIKSVDIAVPYYGQTVDVPNRFVENSEAVTLWLQKDETRVDSNEIKNLLSDENVSIKLYEDSRFVHGKWFRVETDVATYSLMGSPNASQSALLKPASGGPNGTSATGNIEMALLQRRPGTKAFDDVLDEERFDIVSEHTTTIPDIDFPDPSKPESNQSPDTPVRLNSISFRPDVTESAGELTVSFERRSSLIDSPDQVFVCVNTETGDDVEIPLRSQDASQIEAEGKTDAEWENEVYERTIYQQEWVDQLSSGGTASILWGESESDHRWVQYDAVDSDKDQTTRTADDAGANAVVTNLSKLLLGDEETTEQALASLQGVLASLNALSGNPIQTQGPEIVTSPKPQPDETDDGQGDQTSSSVTPTATHTTWQGSTSEEDAGSLVESFLDGWSGKVKDHREQLVASQEVEVGGDPTKTITDHNIAVVKDLGRQLGALNTVTACLDVLNEYGNDRHRIADTFEEITRDLPNRYRDIYFDQTKVGGGGGSFLDSDLWGFLDYAQRICSDEYCQASRFTPVLHNSIGSAIIAASILCESQLDCYDPYTEDSTWPFAEQYVMSLGNPTPPNLQQSLLEWGQGQLQSALEPTKITIEKAENKKIQRHLTDDLQTESDMKESVAEFYARAVLLGAEETNAWTGISLSQETIDAMDEIADTTPRMVPDVAAKKWGL